MAGGPPITSPGVTLPGAEYFAIAPNRSIALGPRLALSSPLSAAQSVPAGAAAIANTDVILDPQFVVSKGIWLVNSYLLFVPADFSAELVVQSARMGVGPPPALAIALDTGTPLATFATPITAQVVIRERDQLITGLDLNWGASQTGLHIYHQVGVHNNDATNPHSFQIQSVNVWHNVSGFVQ